jgi:hypothetical protein
MEFWVGGWHFLESGRAYLSSFSADFHISAELFRKWVDGVLKWYWYLISDQALGHEVFVDTSPALSK